MSSNDWRGNARTNGQEVNDQAKVDLLGGSFRDMNYHFDPQNDKADGQQYLLENMDGSSALGSLHVEDHHHHSEANTHHALPEVPDHSLVFNESHMKQLAFVSKNNMSAYDQYLIWREHGTMDAKYVRAPRSSGNSVRNVGSLGKGKRSAAQQLRKLGIDISDLDPALFTKLHMRRLVCQVEAIKLSQAVQSTFKGNSNTPGCQSYIRVIGWSPGKFEESAFVMVDYYCDHSHDHAGVPLQRRVDELRESATRTSSTLVSTSVLTRTLQQIAASCSLWSEDTLDLEILEDMSKINASCDKLMKKLRDRLAEESKINAMRQTMQHAEQSNHQESNIQHVHYSSHFSNQNQIPIGHAQDSHASHDVLRDVVLHHWQSNE